MKYLLAALFAVVCALALRAPASATACTIPNTFTAGTSAVAAQVNSNFVALQSCGNNIDHTNMGTAGIYAANIIPDSTAHATFGGSVAYTFPTAVNMNNGGAVSGSPFSIAASAGGGTSQCTRFNASNQVVAAASDCPVMVNGSATAVKGVFESFTAAFVVSSCPSTVGICSVLSGGTITLPVTMTSLSSYTCLGVNYQAPLNGYNYLIQNSSATQATIEVYTVGPGFNFSTNTNFTIAVTCQGY